MDFFIIVLNSVINDVILPGYDRNMMKVTKILRILRPLRFISHNKNLKIIVNSLVGSFAGILNVIIVIFLVFIMYSILGVYLIGNKMNYCFAGINSKFDYMDVNKH